MTKFSFEQIQKTFQQMVIETKETGIFSDFGLDHQLKEEEKKKRQENREIVRFVQEKIDTEAVNLKKRIFLTVEKEIFELNIAPGVILFKRYEEKNLVPVFDLKKII